MRSVVLAQLRRHPARYVATALAIILGTAFVAVGFLFTSTLRNTLGNALVADVVRADVVAGPKAATGYATLSTAQVRAVTGTPGAVASVVIATGDADTDLPRLGRQQVTTQTVATDPRLLSQRVVDGRAPRAAGEVAIGASAANATGLGPGSTVTLSAPAEDGGAERSQRYTVVGTLDPRGDLAGVVLGLTFFFPDTAGVPGPHVVTTVGLLAGDSVAPDQLRDTAAARLAALPAQGPVDAGRSDPDDRPTVATVPEYRAASVARIDVAVQLVGAFVLAFAILALAIAGLVIANTFVILLTQRTRELALLRCVGAAREQVFRSVVTEAAVLGGVSAVVGIALAWGVSAAAVAVANRIELPVVIAAPGLTWTAAVIPLAAGLLVTVVAALAPARRATAVAPVAALRQDLGLAVRNRKGLVRLVLGALLIVAGALGLVAGRAATGDTGVLLTALGGAVSFLGVLAAARLFVPTAARGVGAVIRLVGGLPARLGVVNVLRNPARATATCTALVIGVTLVSLVGVGAATAKASALSLVLGDNPVDVTVSTGSGGYLSPADPAGSRGPAPLALPAGAADRVEAVRGIEQSTVLAEAAATVRTATGERLSGSVFGADPAALADVAREDVTAGLRSGVALFGSQQYAVQPVRTGDRVQLVGARGAVADLTAQVDEALPLSVLVDSRTLAAVAGSPPVPSTVWARTAALDANGDIDEVDEVVNGVRRAIGEQEVTALGTSDSGALVVAGGAGTAAALVTVLDAMVKVLTALLAVALVIALVGIANTLSLSVLERRRENGLLRALGLGRAQLRATIAWEAVTLALVAVALGLGLGIFYAWLGTRSIFTGATEGLARTVFVVPVGQTLLLVAVAVAAGLLASVLPARRAALTSPAAVLAED